MKICYNVSAMIANNALTRSDNKLSQSLQRLSSGLKITEAKDNPSGMAMGKRMNAQVESIAVASQNSNDAISVIETADGALSEIHEILQRMNELAVKSSTGTMTDEDRKNINSEITQLKQEITRISKTTEFNGQTLLDGSFDLRGYTSQYGLTTGNISDKVVPGVYEITELSITYDADGNVNGVIFQPDTTGTPAFPADATVSEISKGVITITSPSNPDFKMDIKCSNKDPVTGTPIAGTVKYSNVKIDITGFGGMTMQIGANEGQTLDIRIPKISLIDLSLDDLSLATEDSSKKAIGDIGKAIATISANRSTLGAYQNRLEHNVKNLDTSSENMTAAYSRIMDVDMAEEMTLYTTEQVISQASMSMLAQANERPSQVLQLLQ